MEKHDFQLPDDMDYDDLDELDDDFEIPPPRVYTKQAKMAQEYFSDSDEDQKESRGGRFFSHKPI